jgi:ABC-type multidrug transport system ATPase subunit
LEVFYEFKSNHSGGDSKIDKKVQKEQIDKLIKDSGLEEKKDCLAFQLSGGNKRKLSVCISLVG